MKESRMNVKKAERLVWSLYSTSLRGAILPISQIHPFSSYFNLKSDG